MTSAAGEEVTSVLQEGEQDHTTDMVGGRKLGVESFIASAISNVTSYHFTSVKNKPRFLLDLKVSVTDPVDDIAAEISKKLYEPKSGLILKMVKVLGGEKAIELYKETQKLEEAGGMLSNTRRRTSGGIYLFLITHGTILPQKVIKQIIKDDRIDYKCELKVLRERTRKSIKKLLQNDLTDSEERSLSRAETAVQSEQPSNPHSPEPVTDARDCSWDTDGYADALWAPWAQIDDYVCVAKCVLTTQSKLRCGASSRLAGQEIQTRRIDCS